jgi:hypothetical protein
MPSIALRGLKYLRLPARLFAKPCWTTASKLNTPATWCALVANEEDMLDKAWGLEPNSRLSCQAILAQKNVVVEIPKYSVNHAKEVH